MTTSLCLSKRMNQVDFIISLLSPSLKRKGSQLCLEKNSLNLKEQSIKSWLQSQVLSPHRPLFWLHYTPQKKESWRSKQEKCSLLNASFFSLRWEFVTQMCNIKKITKQFIKKAEELLKDVKYLKDQSGRVTTEQEEKTKYLKNETNNPYDAGYAELQKRSKV